MFGPRLVSAALLILLLAGLVGGALITRFRYYDSQGVPLFRIDRRTGVREGWDCRVFKTDESGKILAEWTGADEPVLRVGPISERILPQNFRLTVLPSNKKTYPQKSYLSIQHPG